jgi:hypothetical protein
LLTSPACAELGPGASVSRYRPRLHSTCFRHHLLPVPRLWHNRWHCHLRCHRFERHQQHAMRCALEPVLELSFRTSLRFLHNFHSTGQVQANAGNDIHCNSRIHSKLLRQHALLFFSPNFLYLRSIHYRCLGEFVQPTASWRCRSCPSACRLRSSSRQSCVQWQHKLCADHCVCADQRIPWVRRCKSLVSRE